jgi:hypothetical protein
MSNKKGLWLSSFQQGAVSELPPDFQGEGNIALFFATDTGALYVAKEPDSGVAAEWAIVGGAAPVLIANAATATILAVDTGRTHIIPELTADCTISLPEPAEGLDFEFIGGGFAIDAQSWIFTTGTNTNYFVGGVTHLDTDANSGGDEVVSVFPDGNSNSKLTVAVPNPGATRIRFIANGATYIVQGAVASATAPAFADQ